MMLDACPDIADYAKGGISHWRDLLAAAGVARKALGVSPSAWEGAQAVLGEKRRDRRRRDPSAGRGDQQRRRLPSRVHAQGASQRVLDRRHAHGADRRSQSRKEMRVRARGSGQ